MSISKPLYKMTIDLTTYRPEALKDALDRIRDLVGEQDQTAGREYKTKVTIESDRDDALRAIRDQLEIYLRHHKTGIEGEVSIKEPLVRPRPEPTPMDRMLGDVVESVTARRRDIAGWGNAEPWEA